MTMKYFAILTNQGTAKLANATALGTQLKLTHMATGDGNGSLPTPDPAQTKLVNQKRIAPLNMLFVDPGDANQIIAEQVIPENEGGFWIREIGLYDADGTLIAVANCPETYKPLLLEGSARTQTLRMALVISATSAVSLKIDPAVVLATRKYVDDKVIEVKAYTDNQMKEHIDAANPHKQYPLIANALKEMADAGLLAEVLKNLGLTLAKRVEGNSTYTGITAPDSGSAISIFNDHTWGAFAGNEIIPLAIAAGGTGSKTTSVARSNLGLKAAATKDVGTGSGQIPDMSSFTAYLDDLGYQKLPGGLMLQWGKTVISDGQTVNLPLAFPSKFCTALISSDPVDTSSAEIVQAHPASLSTFTVGAATVLGGATSPVSNIHSTWLAIGF
ncbi:phage tail protein [Kosakonia cowanii]|uniref:phage tail protein n=1 Tax=Kosakonia cowanii TaxID=208223 RepID=UPI00289660FF|nr:phage tail protein [Kosakonia cowanii]